MTSVYRSILGPSLCSAFWFQISSQQRLAWNTMAAVYGIVMGPVLEGPRGRPLSWLARLLPGLEPGQKKRRTKPNWPGSNWFNSKALTVTHPLMPIANEPNLPVSTMEFVGSFITHVHQVKQECDGCVGAQRFGASSGTESRSDWHRAVPKGARKARQTNPN